MTDKLERYLKGLGLNAAADSKAIFESMDVKPGSAKAIEIFRVLADCVRAGLIRKTIEGTEVTKHSSTELTDYGMTIVKAAILPIINWSKDPNSVADIRQIALNIGDVAPRLLHQMAEIFLAKSPYVNRDSKYPILELVEDCPLTKTEIANHFRISIQTVARRLRLLIDSGNVEPLIDSVSKRTKFAVV